MPNRAALRACASFLKVIALTLLVSCLFRPASRAAEANPAAAPAETPGISRRVPWTTSRIVGTPEPPSPYLIQRAFPNLEFRKPLELCGAPGSDRLFLLEEGGRAFSFPNRDDAAKADPFFDISGIAGAQTAYGMAFHPGYETNRHVFLCYILRGDKPDGSRVSRFTVKNSEPPAIDPASERIMITWQAGGHNGGCLKFGPDGFLYITTGDAASPNPPDPLKTGQDNSDLLSSVLRIDVDHADGGRNYRVPADNPFINLAGNRPEIWAYGFRNPWKIGFDRKTGELWLGDVGWELWELVYRIERGGNYGWSIVEGPQSVYPDGRRGPTPILPSVKAHPHSEAASITGGIVYRGAKLKDLVGAYVYGDWITGKIWGLRSDGNRPASVRELVDTPLQVVAFSEDNAGEFCVVDYLGKIYRLVPNPAASVTSDFPRKLSETGLFAFTRDQIPAPGVIPFLINAEMWADHALAERYVALPGTSSILTSARDVWIYQSKGEWRFPTNAVLAKTLYLYTEPSRSAKYRKVETQVLHFNGADWNAYSYKWNDSQDDATLVGPEGAEIVIPVKDNYRGGARNQTWRFHSRAECLRCHNPWVNYALAFTGAQLNLEVSYQSDHAITGSQPHEFRPSPWIDPEILRANQLRTFSHIGFFDRPLDERSFPKLAKPYPGELGGPDLTLRARSWLHVNCGHCHRFGAGGSVVSQFDIDSKLEDMKAVGAAPLQGAFGLDHARVIKPGDPYGSTLYYRIMTTGQGRMPLLGSRLVDVEGVHLVHEWIKSLPETAATRNPETAANSTTSPQTSTPVATLRNPRSATEPGRRAPRELWSSNWDGRDPEYWISTPGRALELATTLSWHPPSGSRDLPKLLDTVPNHPSYQVRDLFERFLPEEKRVKKLGTSIDPASILTLQGDAAAGRRLFFQEGAAQCAQCHRLENQGRDFGPDLSVVGRKYDRSQMLEHLLKPSLFIDPAYINHSVETRDEASYTGFVTRRTPDEIVLKNVEAQEVRLPSARIKQITTSEISAMPEGLLQTLTAQQAADLLEYLTTLR